MNATYPGQNWQQHAQATAQQAVSDPGPDTGSGQDGKTAVIAPNAADPKMQEQIRELIDLCRGMWSAA